jgi:hypothetical protein
MTRRDALKAQEEILLNQSNKSPKNKITFKGTKPNISPNKIKRKVISFGETDDS